MNTEFKIKCPKHDTGGGPRYCDKVSAPSSNDVPCNSVAKAKSYAEHLKFKGLDNEADCIFNLLQELKEEKLRVELLRHDNKFKELYVSVNEMMSPLGAHGKIYAKDDRVSAVMDALHDIDGGVYNAEKIFGATSC